MWKKEAHKSLGLSETTEKHQKGPSMAVGPAAMDELMDAEQLEEAAKKKLPEDFWDYIMAGGGSWVG